MASNCFRVLTRKKILDPVAVGETQLARVLNTFDLTALGVGSTLGVGVYVLAGDVAKDTAGPAVVLSFLIAALASVFAGLCYAEFGSRVPRAGSAYVYSYVCIGEFVAFIIGWNLILEYVIGSASVARALSSYLDTLINHSMEHAFRKYVPIHIPHMSEYFDFFAYGITLFLAVALAFGMKESSFVNNLLTILNIFVVLFVIVVGAFKAHPRNWNLPAPHESRYGSGGFLPYGLTGVIQGAAKCFYGFVGFDCIATTGEEVRNPQKAIPLSIIASLLVVFLSYFGTATVITLMVPYYEQDVNAPIPHAFSLVGWDWAKWIVTLGGICGLCASLFGAMFPLPRILYAMASDGIIFKFLGNVNARFQTPLVGTILAGVFTGFMAAVFDLKQLVEMMSIGTLLAYTIVAACVLILRYAKDESDRYALISTVSDSEIDEYKPNPSYDNLENTDSTNLIDLNEEVTLCGMLKQTFNFRQLQEPSKISQALVSVQICLYVVLSFGLGLCVMYLHKYLEHAKVWAIVLVAVIVLLMFLVLLSIVLQPTSKAEVRFKVPWVPLIPALSITINVYLMLMLNVNTWIRFGVWMALGLPMYFISVSGGDTNSSYRTSNYNFYKQHALKTNGHISQTKNNGHVNSTFKDDDNKSVLEEPIILEDITQKTSNGKLKPETPNPPPCSGNNSINGTLESGVSSNSPALSTKSSTKSMGSVNDALAALDLVLSKEDTAVYPKPVFGNENAFARKISVDTVSNSSNAHFEESVVALIHREDNDLVTPILEEQIETMSSSASLHEDFAEPNGIVDGQETSPHNSNIPTPPPLEDFEIFVDSQPTTLQKSISFHQLETESKSPKNVSEVESDTQSQSSAVEDVDDNVTFGSKQHQKVVSRLNNLFTRHGPRIMTSAVLLTKPTPSENDEQSSTKLPILPGLKHDVGSEEKDNQSENVIVEEVMKPSDIRKKLNEILRSDPRLTTKPYRSTNLSEAINENVTEEVKPVEREVIKKEDNEVKSKHQQMMMNTLNSIKLRKLDSFSFGLYGFYGLPNSIKTFRQYEALE